MAISASTAWSNMFATPGLRRSMRARTAFRRWISSVVNLPPNFGRALRRFFHPVSDFIDAHKEDSQIGALVQPFAMGFGALQLATGHIAQKGLSDPEEASAAATEYLRLFGIVALGFTWVRAAKIAAAALARG